MALRTVFDKDCVANLANILLHILQNQYRLTRMNKLIVSSCILVKCAILSFGWVHCDVSGILHTREQGNNTYVFYLDNKNLKATVVDSNGKRHDMPIADVPLEAISNLAPEKVNAIANLLNESFFTTEGYKIRINPRGQGGWGDLQHKGYRQLLKLTWYSPAEGTYIWAQDIFESSFDRRNRTVSNVAKILG